MYIQLMYIYYIYTCVYTARYALYTLNDQKLNINTQRIREADSFESIL